MKLKYLYHKALEFCYIRDLALAKLPQKTRLYVSVICRGGETAIESGRTGKALPSERRRRKYSTFPKRHYFVYRPYSRAKSYMAKMFSGGTSGWRL